MNIDLELPISLEGITLRQYQEYLKLSKAWKEDTDEVLIRKETLRIFCGVSADDFDKLPVVVIEQAMTYLSELFGGDTPLIRHFFMEGKDKDGNDAKLDFGFIPKLDDMSFGEFIDLENYMKDWDSMHKAMAVLFRPVIHRRKDYYRIDDYGGADRYSDVMLDMPLNVALGASVFLSFREQITSSYDGLFTASDEGEGSATSAQANFGRRWGWYQSIYELAQGDVRRFDEVTAISVHQCLTMLWYMKDKAQLENKLIKQAHKK